MKASLTKSPWLDPSGVKEHLQKAFDAMAAAKPTSGFCPESEAEWTAQQKAHEEMVRSSTGMNPCVQRRWLEARKA